MCAYFIFCTHSPKYLTQKKYPHPPFYKAKKKELLTQKKIVYKKCFEITEKVVFKK
jgi:hypothetical protein